MAGNTIMTAKNSFLEGLVMDFAPDNTQANTLTSALNATLLTFNGNEMSLLNDMGNGRVETAYLPEGYVPVGTCEFGDIIYIVSYNPIINKALIGCFPSPERNISSEETHNKINVSLKADDFQQLDSEGNPTGELKTSSVKKILFNNDLHPGDQYIIYSLDIDDGRNYISDYGNTSHELGTFPKFLKIHVVSIEESGKINYLDSSVKWYDSNHYYIQNTKNTDSKPDIDSYRSIVSSAYSTFLSKVSGKLALLIELEKITGFSSSWEAYVMQSFLYEWKNSKNEAIYTSTKSANGIVTIYDANNIQEGEGTIESDPRKYSSGIYYSNALGDEITEYGSYFKALTRSEDKPSGIFAYFGTRKCTISGGYYIHGYVYTGYNSIEAFNTNFNNTDIESWLDTYGSDYIVWVTDIGHVSQTQRTGIEIMLEYELKYNDDSYFSTSNVKKFTNDLTKSYQIFLNFSWNTNDNNINPSNIVLTKSEWNGVDQNGGKYRSWKNVGNNTVKYSDWTDINIVLPSVNLDFAITRKYCPETLDEYSYSEFLANYDYNNTLQDRLNTINSSEITKINRAYSIEEHGYPKPGLYYLNCKKIQDGKYYTTTRSGKFREITPISILDDLVNNTFKYPIVKRLGNEFTIPCKSKIELDDKVIYKDNDLKNLIYHYEVTPAMPYGLLREFSQEGYIDFSKLGKEEIKLHTWKYYNYDNTSTLVWGMDGYTNPGNKISDVVFEFYDNTGLKACYKISGKNSYNGTFTEYIQFDRKGGNPNLSDVDYEGNIIKDGGILSRDRLYLVKINIYQTFVTNDGIEQPLGNPIVDYRWYWTSNIYNKYFNNTKDFNDVKFVLDLNCAYNFQGNEYMKLIEFNYSPELPDKEINKKDDLYQTLSALVQSIGYTQDEIDNGNINFTILPGLLNDYNMFNFDADQPLNIAIYLGKEYLKNYQEQPIIKHFGEDAHKDTKIYPIQELNPDIANLSNTVKKKVRNIKDSTDADNEELWTTSESYINYYNRAKLSLKESTNLEEEITYINKEGELITINSNECYKTTWEKLHTSDAKSILLTPISLLYKSLHFSKYYYYTYNKEYTIDILESFVYRESDLEDYNMMLTTNNIILFNKMLFMSIGNYPDYDGGYADLFTSLVDINNEGHINTSSINSRRDSIKSGTKEFSYNYKDAIKKIISRSEKSIFIPVGISYDKTKLLNKENYSDHWITELRKTNFEGIMGYNTDIKGLFAHTLGTLALFDNEGNPYIEDLWHPLSIVINGVNILGGDATKYRIPMILGLLTGLYRLVESNLTEQIPVVQNYAYLDENYMLYERDIILNLSLPKNENSSVLIHGDKFDAYINTVINYSCSEEDKKKEIEDIIKLNFNSCLKIIPIQIKSIYKLPNLELGVPPSKIIQVHSVYNNVPKQYSGNLERNVIYKYDSKNAEFVNCVNSIGTVFKAVNTWTNPNGILNPNEDLVNKNMSQISPKSWQIFTLDLDNKLSLRNIPSIIYNLDTYKILTSMQSSTYGKKPISFGNFESEFSIGRLSPLE